MRGTCWKTPRKLPIEVLTKESKLGPNWLGLENSTSKTLVQKGQWAAASLRLSIWGTVQTKSAAPQDCAFCQGHLLDKYPWPRATSMLTRFQKFHPSSKGLSVLWAQPDHLVGLGQLLPIPLTSGWALWLPGMDREVTKTASTALPTCFHWAEK